jgi:hypothetical protein
MLESCSAKLNDNIQFIQSIRLFNHPPKLNYLETWILARSRQRSK